MTTPKTDLSAMFTNFGHHLAVPVQLPAFGQAANDPHWVSA